MGETEKVSKEELSNLPHDKKHITIKNTKSLVSFFNSKVQNPMSINPKFQSSKVERATTPEVDRVMSSGSSKGSLTGSNTALDLPKSNLSSCDTSESSSLNSLCSSPSAEREMSEEDKNAAKIKNIVTELLQTEEAYVGRIVMIIQMFKKFFLEKADPNEKSYPSAKTVEDMFSNLSSIETFHTGFFLPEIKKRVESWTKGSEIGDIFVKYGPHLRLYTIYVNNYDTSCAIMNAAIKKFPKFAKDLDSIEKKPECKCLKLQHHMLDPIQRVPRYKLLLTEVLKKTAPDSTEYKNIESALEVISASAQKANDRIRETQNAMKMFEIQNMFTESMNIMVAGRAFVKQGDLLRKHPKNNKYVACHLILFNDFIICCSKQSATKYRKKMTFEISTLGLRENVAGEKQQNVFSISKLNEPLILSASTPEEKSTWVDLIKTAITDHDEKMSSFLIRNKAQANLGQLSSQAVLMAAVSVRTTDNPKWENKFISLTNENKIILSSQIKTDNNDFCRPVDVFKFSVIDVDGAKALKATVDLSNTNFELINKYDDLFAERWYNLMVLCQVRNRSGSSVV